MMDIKKFPDWVQSQAIINEDSIGFVPFAKVKFFMLNKQLAPYGNAEFSEELASRLLVAGDKMSSVTNGFRFEIKSPKEGVLVLDANYTYGDKASPNNLTMNPKFEEDDLVFTIPKTGVSPGGQDITKIVISPLSEKELKAANAAYGRGERE